MTTELTVRDRLAIRPVVALSVDNTSTGSNRVILSVACLYVGHSVRETSGSAAASLAVYDGTSSTVQLIASISMVANGSSQLLDTAEGLLCEGGIYVQQLSGSWAGAIYVRA